LSLQNNIFPNFFVKNYEHEFTTDITIKFTQFKEYKLIVLNKGTFTDVRMSF
jgi:hypothetical protein